MTIKKLIIFVLIAFTLAACNAADKPEDNSSSEVKTEVNKDTKAAVKETKQEEKIEGNKDKVFNFKKENFPRIDGSTATIPLSEGIAQDLLKMNKAETKRFVRHNTTHNAYMNLIDKNVDIIFVTEPSDEELADAKNKGIDLEVVPVVKDAFVFLVNTKNPVESLKLTEIQSIYQGKIKNWKVVGGKDTEIIAYQRPKNSGSQTIMENTVMKGLTLMEAPKNLKPSAMEGLIEAVAGYENSEKAIGYSVYYYANSMYTKDTIKLIGVNGVKPDKNSIMSGKYPLTSAYYAVLRKDETKDSQARQLLEWLLTREGQSMAEKCGYIPVK